MQTFLPFRNFEDCARVLDRRRLGNQRLEAKVLLHTLIGSSNGWSHHPAARMWRGYTIHLCLYGLMICQEWRRRGYEDTLQPFFEVLLKKLRSKELADAPSWLGQERLHSSHRAALLYKDFEHYSQFGWKEQPEIHYVWPV